MATASGQRGRESASASERRALARLAAATGSRESACAVAHTHTHTHHADIDVDTDDDADADMASSSGARARDTERCQACGQQLPSSSLSPSVATATEAEQCVQRERLSPAAGEERAPPAVAPTTISSDEDEDSDSDVDVLHANVFENCVKLWMFKNRLSDS